MAAGSPAGCRGRRTGGASSTSCSGWRNIEDYPDNTTRFLVIGREEVPQRRRQDLHHRLQPQQARRPVQSPAGTVPPGRA